MVYIIIAVVIIFVIMKFKSGKSPKDNIGYQPEVEPPTDNAKYSGCVGPIFCGYCTPKIVSSNGHLEMIEDVYECSYSNCDVTYGSPCAFAKERPNQMREDPITKINIQ